jgi:hypothetical protein
MNIITELTPNQLREAADLRERIIELQDELNQLVGTRPEEIHQPPAKRRKLSPQGLANIRAGARKRWARVNGRNGITGAPRKRKGKMSAAGKARVAAAVKARWAAARRAGRTRL